MVRSCVLCFSYVGAALHSLLVVEGRVNASFFFFFRVGPLLLSCAVRSPVPFLGSSGEERNLMQLAEWEVRCPAHGSNTVVFALCLSRVGSGGAVFAGPWVACFLFFGAQPLLDEAWNGAGQGQQ